MLVNLYKTKTPVSVFSMPLLVAVGCLSLFFRDSAEPNAYFFGWQTSFFALIQQAKWLDFLLAGGLITLNAHQLNNVFNRNSFYSKDTFLPGMIYVIGLFSYQSVQFSPDLLGHLFIIVSLSFLLQIKRQEPAKAIVFFGSLFLSLGFIFSPLLVTLAFLPLISLSFIKQFIWREWVIASLGLGLPVLYHYSIYYLTTGRLAIERMPVIIDSPEVTWTITQSVLYLLISIASLIGLFRFLVVMRSEVVSFKKLAQVIMVMLLLSLISFFVGWYFYAMLLPGFFIPLSYVLGVQILNSSRKKIPDLLILAWFIAAVINLYL